MAFLIAGDRRMESTTGCCPWIAYRIVTASGRRRPSLCQPGTLPPLVFTYRKDA
jgi:hypothetical protein